MIKDQLKLLLIIMLLVSCNKKEEPIVITASDFHQSVDIIGVVMVHDIFSPPVASRVFAYPNIAAYEIMAQQNETYLSLKNQLTDLTDIPKADTSKPINYKLAALIAHIDLSKRLIFSEKTIETYRDSLYQVWESKNASEFKASKEYGLKVADFIGVWMDKDNYNQTRTMSKFTVISDDPSRWQPTPPAYMDGLEPHWDKIRPFVINSADQFKPIPPPPFSLEKETLFYKELREVYDISLDLLEKGDDCEEIQIAKFWDCNPYLTVSRGHLMFAIKKITPGAHWIGICQVACKKADYSFDDTVYAYTKTSIAIADAFISCWDEKFRSNLVRPETLINEHIDDNWKPVLQTPPFPEYTSGHSVASGAAGIALTSIFGDNFSFDDDVEVPFGLPIRSFTSFNQASDEAAISRMYGGIHYRAAVEVGVKQGRNLGKFVVENLKMKSITHNK